VLLRTLASELGLHTCVLSRRSGCDDAFVAGFASPAFRVYSWDANGACTRSPPSEAAGRLGPFDDEGDLLRAVKRIGASGSLILLSDPADASVVGSLELFADRTDIRLSSLPSAGSRVDPCRSLWRISLRERLAMLHGITLPFGLSLRGRLVTMRAMPATGVAGRDAVARQLSALRTLHGVSEDAAAGEGDKSDEEEDEAEGGGGDSSPPASAGTPPAVERASGGSAGPSDRERERADEADAAHPSKRQAMATEVKAEVDGAPAKVFDLD